MTMDQVSQDVLRHWNQNAVDFIESVCICPETGQPYKLYDLQKRFIQEAFKLKPDGSFPYSELLFSCIKKSGKSTTAALMMIFAIIGLGEPFAEGIVCSNDREQSRDIIFKKVCDIIRASPLLAASAEIQKDRIMFPSTNSFIVAISSDAGSAAGTSPTLICADEIWAFTGEKSARLLDEVVISPTRRGRSARLVTSYAGFSGESVLLENLVNRGLTGEKIGDDLYTSPGMLAFISHSMIAPWQSEKWRAEMELALRPSAYKRLMLNVFSSSESEFIPITMYDQCVDADARPIFSGKLPLFVGVDCGIRHDSTAIVGLTLDQALWAAQAQTRFDRYAKIPDLAAWQMAQEASAEVTSSPPVLRLVNARVFVPPPGGTLDIETVVEGTLLDWAQRYQLACVAFDPYQLLSTAQRLSRMGLPMIEIPQTIPELTAMSSNLFELLKTGSIHLYPDKDLRLAVQHAVGKESPRGLTITKQKSSHRIDALVALGMAALGAVRFGASWYEFNRASESTIPADFATNFFGR